jgi:hypothetical protein
MQGQIMCVHLKGTISSHFPMSMGMCLICSSIHSLFKSFISFYSYTMYMLLFGVDILQQQQTSHSLLYCKRAKEQQRAIRRIMCRRRQCAIVFSSILLQTVRKWDLFGRLTLSALSPFQMVKYPLFANTIGYRPIQ